MKYFGKSRLINDIHAVECLSNIQHDLEIRNMNSAQLARSLSLNPVTVRQWVNGMCYPNPENYNKLAEFFGWHHFMEGENQ